MNCTHPVLYAKKDGLYCHICGAIVCPDAQDEQEGAEEKPVETPKKAVKRKTKKEE